MEHSFTAILMMNDIIIIIVIILPSVNIIPRELKIEYKWENVCCRRLANCRAV